jgi:membrane dipeptidase
VGANERDGLSSYGREVVAELERCGLVVDVAHVNNRGLLDVAAMATRPLLCTHTGLKSVNEHGRNISDEAVQAIAATGGVIGIIFAPVFLAGRLRSDSACIADHIERVVELVGIEHVAFGSDYDGWVPSIPNDQRDCRDIWRIVAVLLARGWSAEQLDRLLSRNAREVLSGERAAQVARAATSSR